MNVESKKGTSLVAQLHGNPHVSAVHPTMGRWDLIVEIQTESLASTNKIVGELRLIVECLFRGQLTIKRVFSRGFF